MLPATSFMGRPPQRHCNCSVALVLLSRARTCAGKGVEQRRGEARRTDDFSIARGNQGCIAEQAPVRRFVQAGSMSFQPVLFRLKIQRLFDAHVTLGPGSFCPVLSSWVANTVANGLLVYRGLKQ